MTEQKMIPAVRFRGFSDEWQLKKVGDVLTERNILQKISEDAPILAFAAGQGVIDRSERKSNNRDHLTLDQANKFYKLTEFDDIVYNPSNLKYGAIDRNKHGRGVISPIYVTFITDENSSFIEPIVKSEKFKLKALLYEEGTVVKRQSVKPENLLLLDITITPIIDEQVQIGVYFEELARMIDLHQQKHEKLVTLKKAMLKKMFPQNGATSPEIRFKGFSEPWGEKKVKDICSISTGKSNTQDREEDGLYPFYVRSPIIERSNRFLFDEEAVLTVGDGVGTGKVFHYVNGKYDLHQRVYRMFGFDDGTNGKYFYYFFSNHFYKRVMAMTAKTSVDSVRLEMISEMNVQLPSKREQSGVAAYFTAIDQMIGLHGTQVEKLKQIKTACLEKMFV